MPTLDQSTLYRKYDTKQVGDSIASFGQQMIAGWQVAQQVVIPRAYHRHNLIACCGMGGSNLASELIKSVYGQTMNVPYLLVRDYTLPACVTRDSLVIISSYSGGTEESLACLAQARERGVKVLVVTTGGELAVLAKKYNYPLFVVDVATNPSGQPRYGLGLALGVLLAVSAHLRQLPLVGHDVASLARYIDDLTATMERDVLLKKNSAKQAAKALKGRMPLVIAAEHLSANAHILVNQINESAKTFANYHLLPELNHHLLEGLDLPKAAVKEMTVIILTSSLYTPRLGQRVSVTKKVLEKQGVDYLEYVVSGNHPLAQALEILVWGSWVSYYLAMINELNPSDIPWVDFFKKQLAKKSS